MLKRRFAKLPAEVRPEDGVVLLTADPERMQRALEEARTGRGKAGKKVGKGDSSPASLRGNAETSWPRHQLLWANNPVVHWLSGRVRAEFGRHTAPVLVVPRLGGERQAAVIVSGLLPNRRGQPLMHRWYAARFDGDHPAGVEPFEDLLAATRLGREPLPNAGEAVDVERLERLLPAAVEAVERRVQVARDRFRAGVGPRLNDELDRLAGLRGRQLDFIEKLFGGKRDAGSSHRRDQRQRRVRGLFRDYQEWIQDAMTTADEAFLQVVAVLVGSE